MTINNVDVNYTSLSIQESSLTQGVGAAGAGGALLAGGGVQQTQNASGDSGADFRARSIVVQPQLQQLQSQNPTQFKQLVSNIANQLQAASQQATGNQATFLSNLASKFQTAAQTGNLASLQPGGHGHHTQGTYNQQGQTPSALSWSKATRTRATRTAVLHCRRMLGTGTDNSTPNTTAKPHWHPCWVWAPATRPTARRTASISVNCLRASPMKFPRRRHHKELNREVSAIHATRPGTDPGCVALTLATDINCSASDSGSRSAVPPMMVCVRWKAIAGLKPSIRSVAGAGQQLTEALRGRVGVEHFREPASRHIELERSAPSRRTVSSSASPSVHRATTCLRWVKSLPLGRGKRTRFFCQVADHPADDLRGRAVHPPPLRTRETMGAITPASISRC